MYKDLLTIFSLNFKNALSDIINLGCPMSCIVKDLFDDYSKCKNNYMYGLFSNERTKKGAILNLQFYTKKYDEILYDCVLENNYDKFAIRWSIIKKLYEGK